MREHGIQPIVIEEMIDLAEKYNLNKIILFGSRARGDYHRTSDIDLAIWGGNTALFALDVEEETSTLLKFDIVNMESAVQPELIEAIEKEGKVLYEKV